MLLLRGAAGIAWLLAVEPVIKTVASAAIMRPVFIFSISLYIAGHASGGSEMGSRGPLTYAAKPLGGLDLAQIERLANRGQSAVYDRDVPVSPARFVGASACPWVAARCHPRPDLGDKQS
jgi:hypothetical protein